MTVTPIKPKKILRFAFSAYSTGKGISIIDELPQPFDDVDFLWSREDLTVGELDFLSNQVFSEPSRALLWKQQANGGQAATGDFEDPLIALLEKCHFQLILR